MVALFFPPLGEFEEGPLFIPKGAFCVSSFVQIVIKGSNFLLLSLFLARLFLLTPERTGSFFFMDIGFPFSSVPSLSSFF